MSEANRMHVAAGIGLIGGLVMWAALVADDGGHVIDRLRYDWPMMAGALFGAFCAGLATGGLFGRQGLAGGLLAAFGAVLSTGIGSAIGAASCLWLQAGMMENPVAGLIFGPVFVAASILNSVEVLTTWAGCFLLLHQGARQGNVGNSPISG
jgi:hypothetical protein